jgi:hypothetical protein
MKNIFFLVIAAFVFIPCFAQNAKDSTEELTHPEHPAEFPGGTAQWTKYLGKNLKRDLAYKYLTIPKGQRSTMQTVKLIFEIDSTGRTLNIIVENEAEIHPELAKEGIRIITGSPLWKPASQDGKMVADKRRQKLSFVVSSN